MGIEIERKFLVSGDGWRSIGVGTLYRQGYIPTDNKATVRVRVAGETGYLTIKGKTEGIGRAEYEYPIPVLDAILMLDTLCQKPLIEKIRYRIPIEDLIWEVDEFSGENEGLIIAEVELNSEDQVIALPDWIGREVTGDTRYYNVNLIKFPYQMWQDQA